MTKGYCMYKHLPPFRPQGARRDGLASRLSHGLGCSCSSWDLPHFPLLTENTQGGSGPYSSASQNPCFIFLVHSPGVHPMDTVCSFILMRLCTQCFLQSELLFLDSSSCQTLLKGHLTCCTSLDFLG